MIRLRAAGIRLLSAALSLSVVLLSLLTLLGGPGLWSLLLGGNDYTVTLAANWDLALPKSGGCVYETDSGPSFHGDGERYHILEYPAYTGLETAVSWAEAPDEAALAEIRAILDGLDVPPEERPDPESCRWFTAPHPTDGRSRLHLLRNASASRLYVLESFY